MKGCAFVQRSLFVLGGMAAVAGCAGGGTVQTPGPGSRSTLGQVGNPGDGGGTGGVPSPTPSPIDGMTIIGHVTVTYSQASVGGSLVGAGGTVFNSVFHFAQALTQCQNTNTALLLDAAAAIGAYLSTNASRFASAGSDLKIYTGVWLAGGATFLEYLFAVFSMLSIGDWLALLAATGFAYLSIMAEMRCGAIAFAAASQ